MGTQFVCNPCFSSNKGRSFDDHLPVRNIAYTNCRGLNIQESVEDIQLFQHLGKFEGSLDNLVEAYKYNKGVQSIIYHHAHSCSKISMLTLLEL